MKGTIVCFLCVFITHTVSQNVKTLYLSKINDVRYQCVDPGCSALNNISTTDLRDCQVACLSDMSCRTLTYDQSNNRCQLFADIPSQYGDLVTHVGVVTMTAIDERQLSARK